MNRRTAIVLMASAGLAACTTTAPKVGPDGRPLPKVYKIRSGDTDKIYFNLLDAVNTLRQARGLSALRFNAELNAAASTHARDMSIQNRPWHFGSDGSSPLDRVRRVGYRGSLMGELISETYETELETLSAWMGQEDTRRVILDPATDELGFSWWQEENGKIWWTLVTGSSTGSSPANYTPNVRASVDPSLRQ